jgi:hypothetical protein
MSHKPFLPTNEEFTKAREIVSQQLDKGYWPDDEWFSVSDTVDLNLYAQGIAGDFCATLWPVVDGKTDTTFHYIKWHVL